MALTVRAAPAPPGPMAAAVGGGTLSYYYKYYISHGKHREPSFFNISCQFSSIFGSLPYIMIGPFGVFFELFVVLFNFVGLRTSVGICIVCRGCV